VLWPSPQDAEGERHLEGDSEKEPEMFCSVVWRSLMSFLL